MSDLTHIDESGAAHMVDVANKAESKRIAIAEGRITMKTETLKQIIAGDMPKGDVIGTARIAGIMAAKRTHNLIPLCHPLPISKVSIEIEAGGDDCLIITATVGVSGKTGVEMEALTAVSVAGLTLYDMAKAIDKDMVISDIRLLHKSGGKSGTYDRS